ncbi:MAG: NAD+ synthase, partial [Candidatus Omnitrophota bacterium]
MTDTLRIALAQINCRVGDLEANCSKIRYYLKKCEDSGVDIVCFPELSVTGYPPEDLLLKPKFIADNIQELKKLAKEVGDIVAVIGFVDRQELSLYNSAAVIYKGKICGVYHKMFLPNYGVFDEERYFDPGKKAYVFKYGQLVFGVNICEDIWHKDGPAMLHAKMGAKLILNINASPYYSGKVKLRESVLRSQAKKSHVSIAYVNLVGGQDELVFDGQSMVVSEQGKVVQKAVAFEEELLIVDLKVGVGRPGLKNVILLEDEPVLRKKPKLPKPYLKTFGPVEEIYRAMVLGARDYAFKNGFSKAAIGVSGGIDSALVAAVAADALGKDNVTGVFMPTRYSSPESEADAKQLCQNLGIKFLNISIEQTYKMYLMILEPHFAGLERNVTEENLQARIRGNILMALSNKFNWLILTTGNKSEMSTGYATLYGDMAGGLAVVKDVPKTLVYKISRWRNSVDQAIPERVFTKPPTAELRHNQKDEDTLPPYAQLDPILKA